MKVLGIEEIQVSKIIEVQGLLPRVETHTVEEKVEEYKEAMELGSEFPPITVWQKGNEEYWLIDGIHRLTASKRLGRTTIKAEIVEFKDMLEAKVLAITKNRHGLPLTKQEKKIMAQNLYMEGVEIPELMKIFGVSERTIYYWTSGLKRKTRDDKVKEKALEMRRQGYTQEQVARELGVGQSTISDWEREISKPAKIADSDKGKISKPAKIADSDKGKISKPAKIAEMSSSEETEKHDKPAKIADSLQTYEELRDVLFAWIYQTALKIGWEKTFKMLDEAREMMVKEGTDGKELQHLMGWYLQLWNNKPPEMFKFSTKYKSIIAKHLKELIHIYKRNNEDAQQLKRDYESFRKTRKEWNGLLNFRNQLPNIKNKQNREWTSSENSRGKDYYLEYIESLTKDDEENSRGKDYYLK